MTTFFKRMMRLGLVGALAVTGLGVGSTPASAVDPDPVIGRPVFNDPLGTEAQQNAIFIQLARVIDRVPADGELQMSWFGFSLPEGPDTATNPDLAAHVIRAYERGVSVKIILDQDQAGNSVWQRLRPVLGGNDTARSYLVHCADQFPTQNRGCIGTRSISYSTGPVTAYNHNKLLTATKIVLNDGTVVPNIVFQGSSNLGPWDAVEAYNNGLVFSDSGTFQAYRTYFADLRAYRYDSDGNNNYYRVTPTGTTYKAHFFPRHESSGAPVSDPSTDTVVNILNSVYCSYYDNGVKRQTDVRVAMFSFTRTEVAKKLTALRNAGCWVDVVVTDISDSALAALGSNVQVTRCNFNTGPGLDIRVHSKYMLIDGGYDDDIIPRVFTGSHNYAVSALRQADETLLRVMGRTVHDDYMHNFWYVRDTCRAKPNGVIH